MSAALNYQPVLVDVALAGFRPLPVEDANDLVVAWDHNLGRCERPFHSEAFVLEVFGEPTAVAISATTVSATVDSPHGSFLRDELVELARLAAANKWANRVMLRLWREIAAPLFPGNRLAAVAYSESLRHPGSLYRADGWELWGERKGSSGGGTWSRKQGPGQLAHGPKRCWGWVF